MKNVVGTRVLAKDDTKEPNSLEQKLAMHRTLFIYDILHCNENPIYLFPEMELHGPFPNSYILVSVSDLYILQIALPI
jgi:hypothetical protein